MKKVLLFPLLLLAIAFSAGCGLSDITENANNTLLEAEDLIREIDKQVESGKLTQDIADKAKEVANSVIATISEQLQQNVGFIFNNVNQTLDNTFYNLGNLIITLKTEILGGTAIDIIEKTASQIRLTITQLSSELQDIILLVSGQVFIFLDKTTNFIIILVSIILLAIGLIIFVIIFLAKKGNFSPGSITALVLTGIYVLFFLAVIIVTPLRVWMISGFDIGSKITPKVLAPKIVSVFPEKFIPGLDDRLYIYGRHLNLISKPVIKLQQGNSVKKVFPDNTLIVKNYSQILLGNLDNTAGGFRYLDFDSLKLQVIDKDVTLKASSQIENILNAQVEKTFTGNWNLFIKPIEKTVIQPSPGGDALIMPAPQFMIKQPVYSMKELVLPAVPLLETPAARLLQIKANLFAGSLWDIAEGLYGVYVYDTDKHIEDAAALEIDFPDPPAPKPDIRVVDLTWAGDPVKGKSITPRLVLGFTDHKEIKQDFFVRLISIAPAGYNTEFMVKKADIASIPANGLLTLYLNPYVVNAAGTHRFEVFADSKNSIAEKSEANNKQEFSINAKSFRYDVTVTIQVFNPKKSYDTFEDEYRVRISTYLNGSDEWKASINKDGEPSNSWNVNITHDYSNVSPGDAIYVYTYGFESDSPDGDDDMGHASDNFTIQDTGASDIKNTALILNASGYELKGQYTVNRSVVQ